MFIIRYVKEPNCILYVANFSEIFISFTRFKSTAKLYNSRQECLDDIIYYASFYGEDFMNNFEIMENNNEW